MELESTPREASRMRPIASFLVPVGLAIAVAVAGVSAEPTRRQVDDQRYVIPPGTGERARAGLSISDVMPRIVNTRVGQLLVVKNEDITRHVFGPFVLDPGQSWSRAFASSGDYALDCSIYPTAGFTIEVAPAEGALGVTELARQGWLGIWLVVACAIVGVLGLAAMGFGRVSSAALIALALPATAIGHAVLGAASLSRLAAWGPVLGSRSMLAWAGASLLALAGAVWLMRASRAGVARRAAVVPPIGFLLAALVLTLWPDLGLALAARAAFVLVGAALLAAGLWLSIRPVQREYGDQPVGDRPVGGGSAGGGRLAAIGLVLFLVGLPHPSATPPIAGLLAVPGMVLGIGLIVWAVRRAEVFGQDRAWFVGAAGMMVVLLQTTALWSAVLGHLDAVTLPAWGNPVPVDAASVVRGDDLWSEHCASCHEVPPNIEGMEATSMLEMITDGHANAPGFAYEIDVYSRGDIINALRAGESGE